MKTETYPGKVDQERKVASFDGGPEIRRGDRCTFTIREDPATLKMSATMTIQRAGPLRRGWCWLRGLFAN